jgi:hypothetical protein
VSGNVTVAGVARKALAERSEGNGIDSKLGATPFRGRIGERRLKHLGGRRRLGDIDKQGLLESGEDDDGKKKI